MFTWLGVVCWTWTVFTQAGYPYNEQVRNIIREMDVYVHSNAQHAAEWLTKYNTQLQDRRHSEALTNYMYLTDMTDVNLKKLTKVQVDNLEWDKTQISVAKKFLAHIDEAEFINKSHYRMLRLITGNGVVSNQRDVNQKMSDLRAELEKIYGTTKVDGKTLDDLENDIKSGTYEEKLSIWKKWRDAVGPKMRPIYTEFIKYQNIAARESGYANLKEAWILADYGYETTDLEAMAEKLLSEILPLYKQLHAYVRRKLYQKYPQHIDLKGPIPAHLLGNMWAQQWENTEAELLPYPTAPAVDVTPVLKKKKYTPKMMFKLAEAFFESIGLKKMTHTFWEKSMMSRPEDREVQCHASATDMYQTGDFRIKMCTNINQDDLFTIHHEMGHIQYFMEYANQPTIFRNGANAAFHEAIGDTIALSVSTPAHFQTIGLLPSDAGNSQQKTETDLNFLMSQALQKIAFLPFGYMIDKYRWDIFTGDISDTDYNSKWWQMREKYQGVASPVPRTEHDFDPGAKYHVPAHVPYSRYFLSFIAQFQFYDSMCAKSGHTGEMYQCDFYNSKPAGSLLKSMLELGQSVPWQQAMNTMTGQEQVSATAIVQYFQPLQTWLENENKNNNEYIGWM